MIDLRTWQDYSPERHAETNPHTAGATDTTYIHWGVGVYNIDTGLMSYPMFLEGLWARSYGHTTAREN